MSAKVKDRPAEWATLVGGIVTLLVLLGVDADTAERIVWALVAVVAGIPGVVTWFVEHRR